jgi:hypothetical protein
MIKIPYKDKNKKRLHDKEYREKNKEYIKKCRKEYREKNKDKIAEYNKKWREQHPEYYKKWFTENKERFRQYRKVWDSNNREHRKMINKRRIKIDLKFNLNHKMSRDIYKALKKSKAGRRWEDLIGYTVKDLIKHLKKTMPKGYSWADYIKGKLHIDHIIPKSAFNYTKPEHIDFKRCWALENLQLLPAEENMKKKNKIIKPFQPALKI